MSISNHHAIIVTRYPGTDLAEAHAKAVEIFDGRVSPIVSGRYYDGDSFFIPPDGGGEGREVSNDWDERRRRFKEWLRALPYKLEWIEVEWGVSFYRAAAVDSWLGEDACASYIQTGMVDGYVCTCPHSTKRGQVQ